MGHATIEQGGRMKKAPKVVGFFAVVFLIIAIAGACANGGDKTTQDASTQPKTSSQESVTKTKDSTSNQKNEEQTEPPVKEEAEKPQPEVPTEYLNALVKADSYANSMFMSKKGVYDQLVSEYGEQFSKKAAEYAIKNVEADWNNNALVKAREYQEGMSMSPKRIHDQLTSSYGEKFTKKQADYAIKHLKD